MYIAKKMRVDIVSVEQAVFSGDIEQLIVMGVVGELGVMPGHSPLLTFLQPGEIRLLNEGQEDNFYVSGGTLEVQPDVVTILADTICHAKNLDEMHALEAQKRAKKALKDQKTNVDYQSAVAQLTEALAQLRTIQRIKRRR
jgi:F-type H+-transporting ATPase subunit epsilon